METDASGVGLGAVLAKEIEMEHFILWHMLVEPCSSGMQPHEQNYGATELEWCGHNCIIFTDHEVLKSLINTPHPSSKLARSGLILQDLDLEIKYRPGKKNSNADALSRHPIDVPLVQDTTIEVSGIVATIDSNGEVESKDEESTLYV